MSQASATKPMDCNHLKKLIREIPDFPKKGILFYDITTLLKDKTGFATLIDALAEYYIGKKIDAVIGIEARGFIFGPALAYRLNAGFVPVRKPKKLPAETHKVTYQLEYGSDSLELHKDAVVKGQRVVIVDDLLATGGTAAATVHLARQAGAEVVGLGFVVELDFLHGRSRPPRAPGGRGGGRLGFRRRARLPPRPPPPRWPRRHLAAALRQVTTAGETPALLANKKAAPITWDGFSFGRSV